MAKQDQKSKSEPGSTTPEELERLHEREEEGLEPEKRVGPRQNEGISSAGELFATQEEADEANPSKGARRDDVDRDAAIPRGEPPKK